MSDGTFMYRILITIDVCAYEQLTAYQKEAILNQAFDSTPFIFLPNDEGYVAERVSCDGSIAELEAE